ncbi:hypothetical protein [Streptomyces lomondensis]|uniref:Uncharacterized protein n=1 Tax=Streptomyces lomondensis TaxID=68229 RepID=A0ABQ2XUL2_9ACTN|nr:hypothetical protein [Streptomyces lomondensis]MCF0082936.1 hypothetical protein [Streptomyces lomondensis]GGX35049.1 hypothetical protein GCM10010383_76570 [Streptomyces lomondensis]
MARLVVDGEDVVIRLAPREALPTRRREVRVRSAHVRAVRVEPDWWRVLRGAPLGGRCRPGRWCVGERIHPLGRDFVVVRAGVPVVVLDLWRPVPFTRLAVSVADAGQAAESVRGRLRA